MSLWNFEIHCEINERGRGVALKNQVLRMSNEESGVSQQEPDVPNVVPTMQEPLGGIKVRRRAPKEEGISQGSGWDNEALRRRMEEEDRLVCKDEFFFMWTRFP